jgi:hypothetical protein
MGDFFKAEVTERQSGKDRVEIRERTEDLDAMDQLSGHKFGEKKDLIDKEMTRLRETYLRLNEKLRKAQGVAGTDVGGLSDDEIKLAATTTEKKMNELGAAFLDKLGSIKPESYDKDKADLISTIITKPLEAWMTKELDGVLTAIDDTDADEVKFAERLAGNMKGAIAERNAKADEAMNIR